MSLATPTRILGVAVVTLAALVRLNFTGVVKLSASSSGPAPGLPKADVPPLEYIYLNPARVANYLGQVEDGLSKSEQRTAQLTQGVSASISAGSAAQIGGSAQSQAGTQETVTPSAADRFYILLRLLRQQKSPVCNVAPNGHIRHGCTGADCHGHWLDTVNDQWTAPQIVDSIECVAVGGFVRLTNVQLFVPPFAQVLPRVQSATAYYGPVVTGARTAFTSPTQSKKLQGSLARYVRTLGRDPRIPFIAAPYGETAPLGHGVVFFLPLDYSGLTTEPSLLSGSVSLVGKIIYYAFSGGPQYIDYPTISEFAHPLLGAGEAFVNDIGVCSNVPPRLAEPEQRKARTPPLSPSPPTGQSNRFTRFGNCDARDPVLSGVMHSVTLRSPFVVILPLAIYQ